MSDACEGRRVGMELPAVEVRLENLHLQASVYVDTRRNLPTIANAYREVFEVRVVSQVWEVRSAFEGQQPPPLDECYVVCSGAFLAGALRSVRADPWMPGRGDTQQSCSQSTVRTFTLR